MPFKKGQSGNPGGRPKILEHLKNKARLFTEEGVDILIKIAKSSKNDAVKVSAVKELFDRGWGKAVQATQITGADGGPIEMQGGFIDAPPKETMEQWLARRNREIKADE